MKWFLRIKEKKYYIFPQILQGGQIDYEEIYVNDFMRGDAFYGSISCGISKDESGGG